MKILYISTWFPYPADNGARIRTYNLLSSLADNNDVYLISLIQEDSDPAHAVHLRQLCNVVSLHSSHWFRPTTAKSIFGLFSSKPRSVIDTYDGNIARIARETALSIKPDIIVASTLSAAVYVPYDLGIPGILDEHNCEFALLRRSAENMNNTLEKYRNVLTWKKAAQWEIRTCRKFNCITVVSNTDKNHLLGNSSNIPPIHVIPNGVDTEHYIPLGLCANSDSLVYNGALTYGANIDAIRYYASDIYPLLKKTHPNIKLTVTGRNENVDLSGLDSCPGICLSGYVTDIRDVLRRSKLCVVPLRQGGGSRLKILEAMASGIPVVSTTIGAEGLNVTNGEHLLIADNPEDFALAVQRLLADEELASQLSRKARYLVELKYSWKNIGVDFNHVVTELVSKTAADV